ncbi:MAG: geranylgeranylglyceryl/heptaprenylglyceryl phosphate synthase, partial [Halobacteriales archaeon]|nr:geranylgeranylglyceryl/heptaprenylglyceryl phosphate synthase [Halobacteriales archaeon]
MGAPWVDWDHVLKSDPDTDLPGGITCEDVCTTGTDALQIGGTTGMTEDKMTAVIRACGAHDVPLYQEPSNPDVVVHHDGLEGYFIPTVMNASDAAWITGAHKEWIRIDPDIPWDRTWSEAYV